MLHLHLVDTNPELVHAWTRAFAGLPRVDISCDDILRVAQGALVSPANSHGFMDGGIDEAYSDFFGMVVTSTVRRAVLARPEGHLPVGAALAVATGHPRINILIVAPTMEMPERVPPQNAYRSFRAALKVMSGLQIPDGRLFCPGMATGTGGVPPEMGAREMAAAYKDWLQSLPPWD